ncbi:MAG: ABC transporter permease [Spirochaetota bacterium]
MGTVKQLRKHQLIPIPGILLMLALFAVPTFAVLSEAFRSPDGRFTFQYLSEALSDPYTWRIAWFTFLQALVSTVGSLIIGLPGAYLLSHYQFFGKRALRSIANIPFVLPSILVVLGFVVFFGNSGLLNTALQNLFSLDEPPLKVLYSFSAIILAHTFYNFPICLSITAAYWEQLSTREEQAAYSLGAKPLQVFSTVTLPRLLPPITAAASMIFLFCFTSFSIILVLGGGPQFTTLEVRIYQLARMQFETQHAAAFALISLFITSLVLIVYIRSQFWMQSGMSSDSSVGDHVPAGTIGRILIVGYIAVILLLAAAPLASIVFRSLQEPVHRTGETMMTLRWYRELFSSSGSGSLFSNALSAILNSLYIAVMVCLFALPLALSLSTLIVRLARRRSVAVETFMMLPMAISSVVIGLGYSFIASRTDIPIPDHLFIAAAHLVITLPFLLRSVIPSHRSIHQSHFMASLSLGATPIRSFFSVELPLLRNAVISGLLFVFAISLGEMHATILLTDSSVRTIPILLYRLIGSYNFFGACALGTVLMTISFVLFGGAERLKKGTA